MTGEYLFSYDDGEIGTVLLAMGPLIWVVEFREEDHKEKRDFQTRDEANKAVKVFIGREKGYGKPGFDTLDKYYVDYQAWVDSLPSD